MAVALGAGRVDYVDHDAERLAIAESLGACAIESRPGKGWFGGVDDLSRIGRHELALWADCLCQAPVESS